MRFSLRTLMFFTSIACATLAWMEFHDLDYQFFWTPAKQEILGVALLLIAHRIRPDLALPFAVAGFLMISCSAMGINYLPQISMSAHYGNLPGDASYIDQVRLRAETSVIFPLIALLAGARLAIMCRQPFTPMQQVLLGMPCLIVAIDIGLHIYLLNHVAQGW